MGAPMSASRLELHASPDEEPSDEGHPTQKQGSAPPDQAKPGVVLVLWSSQPCPQIP